MRKLPPVAAVPLVLILSLPLAPLARGAEPPAASSRAAVSGISAARPAAASDLDAFFRTSVERFGLVGLSACVVKDGRVAWTGGFGTADVERGRAVAADSLFNAGSVAKTVTLAAFMRVLERGKCALGDDAGRYLSFPLRNPRFPDRPIALEALLSFTAGIFDVDFQAGRNRLDVFESPRDADVTAEAALREFLVPGGRFYSDANWLDSPPGARYVYSNSSYSLIGAVVERLSGVPFWRFCRDELFAPLRMEDSSWRLADLDRSRLAFDHERTPAGPRKVEPTTWAGYMDGGLRTTAADMGRFLAMMADRGRFEGRQVLRAETVDRMLAPRDVPGAPPGRGFPTLGRAFVWVLSRVGDRSVYQMNGFGPAFFSQVFFDPRRRVAGAFFTTGGFASFEALGEADRLFVERLLDAADRL